MPPSERLHIQAVGPWRLVSKLGQGGMGSVYEAEHAATGARAALKLVAAELGKDPRFVERFRRESQLAKAIRHPNIVAWLDAGEEKGRLYLALELVRGGSLDKVVKKGGLPWREAAQRAAEIARALGALHAAGVIHRDLKPANILLGEKGEAKLTDFGLARDVAAASALTRTGELLGTVEYMAPEQAEGGKAVDSRADLYALGCTLHALLVGHPPFPGSGTDVITKHLTARPSSVRTEVPDTPPALDQLVLSLLAKDPGARPGSASEVAAALARIALSTPGRSHARAICAVLIVGALAAGGAALAVRRAPSVARDVATPSTTTAPRPTKTPPVSPDEPTPDDPFTKDKPAWFVELEKTKKDKLPERLPRGVFYDKKAEGYWNARDRSELIYVPAGKFDPGPTIHKTDGGLDNLLEFRTGPARGEISLDAFFIGKYEASNAQFERYAGVPGAVKTEAERGDVEPHVVNARDEAILTPQRGRAWWRDPHGSGAYDPRWPVVQVTRADVARYLGWAGLRLPTEIEWERAAGWDDAAKKARTYPWGEDLKSEFAECLDMVAAAPHLARVDSHPDGHSPVGAFNMAGNAAEWVTPLVAGDVGLAKGGAFSNGGRNLRVAYVNDFEPCRNTIGFRVARSARDE